MKHKTFFDQYPLISEECHKTSPVSLDVFLTNLDKYSRGDYVSLLQDKRMLSKVFFGSRNVMAKRTFFAYKKCLKLYLEWKGDTQALALASSLQYASIVRKNIFTRSMFRSYEDMIGYIDAVCFSSSAHYTSNDALDVKAIATLLWTGIPHKIISTIKVTDINKYCVVENDAVRKTLTPQQYEILVRYSKLESFNSLPGCQTVVTIPRDTSDLLCIKPVPFISPPKRQRPLAPHREITEKFNVIVHATGNNIELRQAELRRNGAFEYVKLHKTPKQKIWQLMVEYGYNAHDAYNMVADYKVWERVFYPTL